MKKIILLFILPLLFSTLASGETAYIAEIDDTINSGTFEYVKGVMEQAEKNDAAFIIIKLNTEGGLLKPTQKIVDLLLNSEVRSIVYIYKSGGWAFSAGTYILLAADTAVVHPSASIGAAQPIPADEKIVKASTSWIRGISEQRKRPANITEKFVSENLALTGKEALEKGVIDFTAVTLEEILEKFEISETKIVERGFINKFFSLISNPQLASLLLSLGILALFFGFYTGSIEITAPVGVIALAIGLWGIGSISFSVLGLILILLGVGLIIIELLNPGISVYGVAGAIALLIGIFTIDTEPLLRKELFSAINTFVLGLAIAAAAFFILVATKVAKVRKRPVVSGKGRLIGMKALVIESLKPKGLVKLEGEIWTAEADARKTFKKGSSVKVKGVRGNTLIVN